MFRLIGDLTTTQNSTESSSSPILTEDSDRLTLAANNKDKGRQRS